MASEKKLTPRQARFCEEYLLDLNATRAYSVAYAKDLNDPKHVRTCEAASSALLSNLKVSQEISRRKQGRAERVEVKSDDILRELLNIANCDLSEAYNDDGTLKLVKAMPPALRRCISSVESYEHTTRDGQYLGTTQKVKFWDKTRGLELLARHLGLLNDKLRIVDKDEAPKKIITHKAQWGNAAPEISTVQEGLGKNQPD